MTHCLKVWDRKWEGDGGSGQLAISKTCYPC